jgi:hypothetical protein
MEAAMEQQKYDALIAELNALNEMLGLQWNIFSF